MSLRRVLSITIFTCTFIFFVFTLIIYLEKSNVPPPSNSENIISFMESCSSRVEAILELSEGMKKIVLKCMELKRTDVYTPNPPKKTPVIDEECFQL